MARSFEMRFQIGGNIARSFSSSFSRATSSMGSLRNQARQTQRALDQLGNDFRRGSIHQSQYAQSTERLTRELRALERQQRRMSAIKTSFNNGMNTAKQVAGIAAVGAAYVSVGATVNSVNKAMSFEAQLSSIKALTGASATEMANMRTLALKEGSLTKYSALEAAQGIEELLKAGISPAAVQAGALDSALNLATAGGLDLAEAAAVMSTSLNAFSKDGLKSAKAADILAGTANASATDVHELSYAFQMASAVAAGAGATFYDTASAFGVMANKGLRGSDAGTSLKTMLLTLQPTTKKQTKLFKELGLQTEKNGNAFYDSKDKLKPMAEIAQVLHEKFKGLTDGQRQAAFKQAFGTDAIRAANILYEAGAEGVEKFQKEMSKVSALEVAREKMNNAAGSVEKLKGAFETLQIVAGETALPLVSDAANALSDAFTSNTEKVKAWSTTISNGARAIFDPFITVKPTFDPTNQNPDYKENYRNELAKYNKFSGMDFGDKVVYSLEEASSKIEKWLGGSGGDSMNKIFTELGKIAGKAWWEAFKGSISLTGENLKKGNVSAAVATGTAANVLTGGLLLGGTLAAGKGVLKAGKWGYGKIRGRGTGAAGVPPEVPAPSGTAVQRTTPARPPRGRGARGGRVTGSRVVTTAAAETVEATSTSSRFLGALGKGGKIAGKAALPISLALEGYNIYKAKDKTKATVQAAGGVGGGWAGAAAGAAVGSVVPVVGTIIGGLLGGLAGYAGGKWLGGKAVDAARGDRAAAQPVPSGSAIDTTAANNATQALVSNIQLASNNFTLLTTYSGQASGWMVGAFTGIKTSADLVKTNLDLLTSYTGQASGWLASLNGIQTAGQRVVTALNNLETRINNVKLPSASKRVSFDG